MNWILYLFAAAAGMLNTVQAGANAQLRNSLDQPVMAALSVYLTGLMGVLLVLPFARLNGMGLAKVSQAPWWAWMGGLLSIVSTMAGLMLARKLGSAAFTAITVTCGLLCSVLLDHMGWVGFDVHHASPGRLVGCGLLVGGVLLITRF